MALWRQKDKGRIAGGYGNPGFVQAAAGHHNSLPLFKQTRGRHQKITPQLGIGNSGFRVQQIPGQADTDTGRAVKFL